LFGRLPGVLLKLMCRLAVPGIQALVQRVCGHAPTLIVLEATGGYERAVVAALAAIASRSDPAGGCRS
jgi:transposase